MKNSKDEYVKSAKPLRFGLMINSFEVEQWQFDSIRQLLDAGHIPGLIILNASSSKQRSIRDKLKSYPWKRMLFKLWYRFCFRPKAKEKHDLRTIIAETKIISAKTTQKGTRQYFDESDIQHIRSHQLDFILRYGFNIIGGDILKAAKWGVWSFHHDDERIIRGGPPGFYEVYHKHITNGVILQQLTDRLDGGIILQRISLPVIKHSWKAQLDQIYMKSAYLPSRAAKLIQFGQLCPTLSKSKAPIYKPPTNSIMLLFGLKMFWRRIAYHIHTLFLQEDWNTAVIPIALEDFLKDSESALKDTKWLDKPKRHQYIADPFLIEWEGETYLFAEKFDYRTGKGFIVSAKESEAFKIFREVLQIEAHQSFPFVFIHEQNLYCLPENFTSGKLDLYKWDNHKQGFQFASTLIDHIAVIDPILFPKNGLWWLLFGTKDMPSGSLFAAYSKRMEGPYKMHELNPLKTDIQSSRNAGSPFIKDNKLYRFSQDCAGSYGRFVRLNELEITQESFKESEIIEIHPNKQAKFSKGLHTINGNSRFTVIDGKRYIFSFWGLRHQWYLKTKKR